jgi:hypothetical protein
MKNKVRAMDIGTQKPARIMEPAVIPVPTEEPARKADPVRPLRAPRKAPDKAPAKPRKVPVKK